MNMIKKTKNGIHKGTATKVPPEGERATLGSSCIPYPSESLHPLESMTLNGMCTSTRPPAREKSPSDFQSRHQREENRVNVPKNIAIINRMRACTLWCNRKSTSQRTTCRTCRVI